jgi:hypothetical protein
MALNDHLTHETCKEIDAELRESDKEGWLPSSGSEKDLEQQGLKTARGTSEYKFGTDTLGLEATVVEVDNPNLVQWENIDDPANPQNWKRSKKWVAIAIGSVPLLLLKKMATC